MAFGAINGVLIVAQAWLAARILDAAIFHNARLDALGSELAGLLAIFGLKVLAGFAAERLGFAAATDVMDAMRRALLARLDALGPAGLAERPSGEIVATLADGVRAIEPYFSRYLPAVAQAAFLPLAILIVVARLDWISALVFAVTAPLIPFFMILIGKGAEVLNQRQWLGLTRMSGHFLDVIQGLETLKAFNAGQRMIAEVARKAEAFRRDTMAVLRLAFLSALTLEFFATVSIALVAVFVGFRLLWGEMRYAEGLFVLLLAPEFYLPLRAMGTAYHARMEALGAAERIVALMDAPALAAEGGSVLLSETGPVEIRFEDVHLAYPDGRRALDGVSFTLKAGETLALVGPSGAGKSSIQALLLGFARPSSGRILINGVPLETLDLAHWRRKIGYIPQHSRLFSGTLTANIALGVAEPDPRRVEQAANEAAIADLIAALPQRYATLAGEGGRVFSGGEVQRIALARAFYRDAALVLLDEPTAHLDAASETGINAALGRLKSGRTILLIAHRFASLTHADRILVLREGKVDASGTHDDLMAEGGLYAALAGRDGFLEGTVPA
jgi:ATP-binding cassette, subfamily C, bacterial CydD